MIGAGDHDRCARPQQFDEDRLRIEGAAVIDDQNANILNWRGRFWQVRSLDDQLSMGDREPGAGRRDFDCLAQHRQSIFCGTDPTYGIDRYFAPSVPQD